MATLRCILSALLIGVVVSACGGKEKPPTDPPLLSVELSGPAAEYCSDGPVALEIAVRGGVPASVELLVDGAPVASLTAPYQYPFECAGRAERTYEISARASLAGNSFSSQPKHIVVDRVRPTVTGPFTENETEISKQAPIRLTFSEPMQTDRVTANSLALVSASKTLTWSPDQKVLTVTPQEPIVAPQSFVLILYPEDLVDLAGNRLVANGPLQWSWTYPAVLHTWDLPQHGNGVSTQAPPALARDRSGRFVVAWFEYTQASGATDVYVHRSGTSGSTLLGGRLDALAGSTSWVEEVAVAVDASDRPVVAWTERGANELQVFVRRWNGTAWEELGGVPNPIPTADATQLALATGNSDLPTVAWQEVDANQRGRVYVYRWDGSRWDPVSSPIEARTPTASVSQPSLVIDGQDQPVVSVTEQSSDTAFFESAVVWRLEGAVWKPLGSAIRPASASAEAYVNRTSLSLDAQGRPALAFELFGAAAPDSKEVYFTRHGDSGWSSPVWLGGPSAMWPSLGFDAEGAPWVAWQSESQASRRSVHVRRAEGDALEGDLDQASRPAFANGGVGAPIFVVADEQQRIARLTTRQ